MCHVLKKIGNSTELREGGGREQIAFSDGGIFFRQCPFASRDFVWMDVCQHDNSAAERSLIILHYVYAGGQYAPSRQNDVFDFSIGLPED